MHGKNPIKETIFMKQFFLMILSVLLLLTPCGCQTVTYQDGTTSRELSTHAIHSLSQETAYIVAADDALDDYFQMPDFVRDYGVYFCSDRNNLDEFGIFHVSDGHAKEMEALLRAYLTKSLADNRAWYDSYIPNETPKLRDAEVRVFGNYVVYAILSKNDRAALFDAIESNLKL